MIIAAFILSALSLGAFFGHLWTAHQGQEIINRRDHTITGLIQQRNVRDQQIANLESEIAVLRDTSAPFALAIVAGPQGPGSIRVRAVFNPPVPKNAEPEDIDMPRKIGAVLLGYLDDLMEDVGATSEKAVMS